MQLSERIRQIRKLKGMTQSSVAASLNVTQQAYSGLEQEADNAKLKTLRKFCEVMGVELPFLIAQDLPITAENLKRYGQKPLSELTAHYESMKSRIAMIQEGQEN